MISICEYFELFVFAAALKQEVDDWLFLLKKVIRTPADQQWVTEFICLLSDFL